MLSYQLYHQIMNMMMVMIDDDDRALIIEKAYWDIFMVFKYTVWFWKYPFFAVFWFFILDKHIKIY